MIKVNHFFTFLYIFKKKKNICPKGKPHKIRIYIYIYIFIYLFIYIFNAHVFLYKYICFF